MSSLYETCAKATNEATQQRHIATSHCVSPQSLIVLLHVACIQSAAALSLRSVLRRHLRVSVSVLPCITVDFFFLFFPLLSLTGCSLRYLQFIAKGRKEGRLTYIAGSTRGHTQSRDYLYTRFCCAQQQLAPAQKRGSRVDLGGRARRFVHPRGNVLLQRGVR